MGVIWRARDVQAISFGTAITTIATSKNLWNLQVDAVGTLVDVASEGKDLTIAGSEGATEEVMLFGVTASGSQNSEIFDKPETKRTLSVTVIYRDVDVSEFSGATATTVTDAGTGTVTGVWTRIHGGTAKTARSILVRLQKTIGSTTYYVNILMNNATITNKGDLAIDSEGHMTQKVNAECLAQDYYEEDTSI